MSVVALAIRNDLLRRQEHLDEDRRRVAMIEKDLRGAIQAVENGEKAIAELTEHAKANNIELPW